MKAKAADVPRIALALPEVTEGLSWRMPAFLVRGKAFLRYRAPSGNAINPVNGQEYADLLVITVPDAVAKSALVESEGPWFSIPHFDGHNAVLISQADLPKISVSELSEVITDAWASRAPQRLVKEYFAD